VEPLPPDIDTALRIDTRKAGVTPAFFAWTPERLCLVRVAADILSAAKIIFAVHATFRHDELL
jgi:hypothetical protein